MRERESVGRDSSCHAVGSQLLHTSGKATPITRCSRALRGPPDTHACVRVRGLRGGVGLSTLTDCQSVKVRCHSNTLSPLLPTHCPPRDTTTTTRTTHHTARNSSRALASRVFRLGDRNVACTSGTAAPTATPPSSANQQPLRHQRSSAASRVSATKSGRLSSSTLPLLLFRAGPL